MNQNDIISLWVKIGTLFEMDMDFAWFCLRELWNRCTNLADSAHFQVSAYKKPQKHEIITSSELTWNNILSHLITSITHLQLSNTNNGFWSLLWSPRRGWWGIFSGFTLDLWGAVGGAGLLFPRGFPRVGLRNLVPWVDFLVQVVGVDERSKFHVVFFCCHPSIVKVMCRGIFGMHVAGDLCFHNGFQKDVCFSWFFYLVSTKFNIKFVLWYSRFWDWPCSWQLGFLTCQKNMIKLGKGGYSYRRSVRPLTLGAPQGTFPWRCIWRGESV